MRQVASTGVGSHPSAASAASAVGQRPVLPLQGGAGLFGSTRDGAHPWSARSPNDTGQDTCPARKCRVERYYRSMKNVVLLQNYFMPWELERYHEALGNLTLASVYLGRGAEIHTRRQRIKPSTLRL